MSQSSFVCEGVISARVFLQLCSMWSMTANRAGEGTLLITEEALLISAKNSRKLYLSKQEKLRLLITQHFQPLLQGKLEQFNHKYRVIITFEREAIIKHLDRLSPRLLRHVRTSPKLTALLKLSRFPRQLLTPKQSGAYSDRLVKSINTTLVLLKIYQTKLPIQEIKI